MKLDDTLLNILNEVQEGLVKDKGVHLSIEEIHDFVDYQFKGLVMGVSKGFDVNLPKLGTLVNTDKVYRTREKVKVLRAIKELKELDPAYNAEEAKRLAIIGFNIETRKSKAGKINKGITGENLVLADTVALPVFKFFKILNNQ